MTAQKGKDLLLKLDETGGGSFVTIAGLRAKTVTFNAGTVDVTHADSAGQWRELLAGAGVKTARLAGSGVFKDQAADETARQLFFDGLIRDWQVILPDFGTVTGAFQITALEYGGQHDGEVTYEIGLESAGVLTFSAL